MKVKRLKHISWIILLCVFLLPSLLNAEFFTWKDEQGNTHFTDSYHNVPERYRKEVSRSTYGKQKDAGMLSQDTPQRVVVHFESKDNAIFVNAVLNWKHPVIFHVDTGASSTMITTQDALALGINPDAKPTAKGYIADGSVVEFPIAVLSSIRMGEAEVNNVEVAIGNMRLLGMNFLNSFKVHIDAKNGQMVMEKKDLAKEDESSSIRAEKDYTIEELESQIEQSDIAIRAGENIIQEIAADIIQNEEKKAHLESILKSVSEGTRFESSDISSDASTQKKIEKLKEALEQYDRRIALQKSEIEFRQKQIDQLKDRITYDNAMINRLR